MSTRHVRNAKIRFLTSDEGGRITAPASGVRSQIELGEFQTSCVVSSTAGLAELPLGEAVDVEIRLLFPDRTDELFVKLESVELYEGDKLVAVGAFADTPPSGTPSP